MTDEHEHLVVARLRHDLRDLQHLGVVIIADDLASVDAALVVAPLDHRLDRVGHLLVETRRRREDLARPRVA